jgi:hypothetical protein
MKTRRRRLCAVRQGCDISSAALEPKIDRQTGVQRIGDWALICGWWVIGDGE